MLAKALAAATAAAGLDITELFSTSLYTGNGGTQTITNGIDLSGKGGMVWIKNRGIGVPHRLFDTARGYNKALQTNDTAAESTTTTDFTSFNSNGFTLGVEATVNINSNANTYASWTFRKAAKFFDVVTWTGDGTDPRSIPHNLGSVPGCILLKRASGVGDWVVYHRSIGSNQYLVMNSTAAANTVIGYPWANTAPTSTVFTIDNDTYTNYPGDTYVAYLFAHETGPNDVIQCGSYTGNGSASGPTITLDWEPQWLLIKRATGGTASWFIFDTMRGIVTGGADAYLLPDTSGAENFLTDWLDLAPTGFSITNSITPINASGSDYIYIAIRSAPA